ncbi:MAG: YggS family pyridoxal phosphate-dependent enzyme [Candidatus Omnitrophica bacterium]|nr:YggS family pyridoxal phosphate-dependent enzyme [Candidatus Omnitrophota bacterium]
MGIREKILSIRERIERSKRNAPELNTPVLLVGVTKGVGLERLREAIQGGLGDLGENRVLEAQGKISHVQEGVQWHMVGHLQRNKVRDAIQLFHLIHSVDSLRLAQAIEKEASLVGKEVPVLLQVNLQGKTAPFGASVDSAAFLVKEISSLKHLKLSGLMTIAPLTEDPEKTRPYFRRLWELKKALERENPSLALRYLSMGMSQDFEVAIEEGANVVRIGRAIFGTG